MIAGVLLGCADDGETVDPSGYAWRLPPSFPIPKVPADNPMTDAKVELGRHLFYDPRLSANGTQSCASCHRQELAFTDGLAHAVGSTGEVNRRSSMSLANAGYSSAQTWANPTLRTLEMQALVPLLGDNPVELGNAGRDLELLARLGAEPRYAALFAAAFPDEPTPLTLQNLARGLASFQRRLITGDSPYDRFASGADPEALSAAAKRGSQLFFGERFECRHCHGSFALTNSVTWQGKSTDELSYQNNALYNLDGQGAYPLRDRGLLEVTGKAGDMGKFRPPTLRNIAVTAPYMHDGSIATLREVLVDHYRRGGRLVDGGDDAGDGARSPLKSSFVGGFSISDAEIEDLLAFLGALTDQGFLTDPALADPWPQPWLARARGR